MSEKRGKGERLYRFLLHDRLTRKHIGLHVLLAKSEKRWEKGNDRIAYTRIGCFFFVIERRGT